MHSTGKKNFLLSPLLRIQTTLSSAAGSLAPRLPWPIGFRRLGAQLQGPCISLPHDEFLHDYALGCSEREARGNTIFPFLLRKKQKQYIYWSYSVLF